MNGLTRDKRLRNAYGFGVTSRPPIRNVRGPFNSDEACRCGMPANPLLIHSLAD